MKKGFTLIELLVVLAIIAALAGFAIANFGSTEKATQLASMKQDLRNAITQMQIAKINGAVINDNTVTTAVVIDNSASAQANEAAAGGAGMVQVSPGNKITLIADSFFRDHNPADIAQNHGCDFSIVVSSPKVPEKAVAFRQCVGSMNGDNEPTPGADVGIQIVDLPY